MASLVIYKGDDTGGTFGRHLQFTINVQSGVSLTGCTANFTAQGITKSWTNITPGQQVEIVYSHAETASMSVGESYGIFKITDAQGNIRTFDDAIPFRVTDDLREVYPGVSAVTVAVGGLIRWEDIVGRPQLTQADVFDLNCDDWTFRQRLATVWNKLGGKVLNND